MIVKKGLVGRQFAVPTKAQGRLIGMTRRNRAGFFQFRSKGRGPMFLAFACVVEGDIANHLCHPCPEVGPWLKLVQLPQRQQRCFLHDIFGGAAIAGDSYGHEPKGAKGCFKLRSEIQRLLLTARSTLVRRIPSCPAHVQQSERVCRRYAISLQLTQKRSCRDGASTASSKTPPNATPVSSPNYHAKCANALLASAMRCV